MIFIQTAIICSKCGEKGFGVRFQSVEGEPIICEKCIVEAITGKRLPDNVKKYPYLKQL